MVTFLGIFILSKITGKIIPRFFKRGSLFIFVLLIISVLLFYADFSDITTSSFIPSLAIYIGLLSFPLYIIFILISVIGILRKGQRVNPEKNKKLNL
ncbi:hypothetical protein IW15_06550 [Chryseobacterium soli]|uniref:Uncharacterized protein n=1 Tax=Chryseobacterium soli TaxID=445961 RepID=A0A086A9T4_9FLAO|nr:hypothetical protein IW15_06550 [Chryseobacterium soli]